jgi:hypothetical protein
MIPFLFVFASMLRPTRKISFISICLFTAVAFAVVQEGTDFAKRRLGFLMAVQDTKCTFGFLDQVTKNYAPNLIAKHIAYKINNDALKSHTYFAPLVVATNAENVFLLSTKLKVELTWQLQSQFLSLVRQSYCSDSNPYWVAARRINYRVFFLVYDRDDAVRYQQLITPKDCLAWPAPNVLR